MKTRIGQIVLILVFIFALGAWPIWKFYGSAALIAMGYATGMCGVAALLSLIPVELARSGKASTSGLMQACMLGTIIRLFFTLIGGMVVYKILDPLKWAFALWLVFDYLILLIWETRAAVRLVPSSNRNLKT